MEAHLFTIIGWLFVVAVVAHFVTGSWMPFAVVACAAFALFCVGSGLGG